MLALPRAEGCIWCEGDFAHQASFSTSHFYSTDPPNLGLAGGGGSKFPWCSNSCFSSSQRAAGTDSDEEQKMDVAI